jgi:hypothetical protein
MSAGDRHGGTLLGPLYGRTTTFMVDSRRTNLALAWSLVRSGARLRVLDIDALYSSNSEFLFGGASDGAEAAEIIVPEPGFPLEREVAGLLGSGTESALVVDSLNSLYHLLPAGGRGSRNTGLAFVVALLSFAARTQGVAVILTMYVRERAGRLGRAKSISDMSDASVSASLRGGSLNLRRERGPAWPGGSLSVPIPSG